MNKFSNFYQGNETEAYKLLGCHKVSENSYHFAVWAPNAKAVCVIGDFNNWLVNHNKLELVDGIWQTTIDARAGDNYKFAITTQTGNILYKADPYARYSEVRPGNASVLYDEDYEYDESDDFADDEE